MAGPSSSEPNPRLARAARQRLVQSLCQALPALDAAALERLGEILNQTGTARETQLRRDAWTEYQRLHARWSAAVLAAWQALLQNAEAQQHAPVTVPNADLSDFGLQLQDQVIIENQILVNRLAQSVLDKIGKIVDELRPRLLLLDGTDELARNDVLRIEVVLAPLIEQWLAVELSRESWLLVQDAVRRALQQALEAALNECQAFLTSQGVPTRIKLRPRLRQEAAASAAGGGHGGGGAGANTGGGGFSGGAGGAGFSGGPGGGSGGGSGGGAGPGGDGGSGFGSAGFAGGAGGFVGGAGGFAGGGTGSGGGGGGFGAAGNAGNGWPAPGAVQGGFGQAAPGGVGQDGFWPGAAARAATDAAPSAVERMMQRAQGVVGQLRRLLIQPLIGYDGSQPRQPSAALAQAMDAARPLLVQQPTVVLGATSTVVLEHETPDLALADAALRQRTADLKKQAGSPSEKATIEIVALMFQSILAEDRIPAGVRVWFARLQIPVLRVALAEPEFFGTLDHPARQLLDRMGACVMGFDAVSLSGSALETEIRRVVQVVEQYPETGRRVFAKVYQEFLQFLANHLTEAAPTQRVVSVVQQMEQKETLSIQYTIELRNLLKDLPIRDEIRQFFFKVWADVLAQSAVRHGPQHAVTLDLKRAASELVWAASAKPNRSDRTRVIQGLPSLLQKLRLGMTLLGLTDAIQDVHVQVVSDTLADAFMSKTEAIPSEQIAVMASHLEHLEDFVDVAGDDALSLDAQSIELLLGVEAASLTVLTDAGAQPSDATLAWAQALLLGTWFSLDHNGQVSSVQLAWRSERRHLHLFAARSGHGYLIQSRRLAAYLQAGLLQTQEQDSLTIRATRDALAKIDANPERLLH